MDHMQGWEGRTEVESWLREVGTYYAGSLADIDWQKGAMGVCGGKDAIGNIANDSVGIMGLFQVPKIVKYGKNI